MMRAHDKKIHPKKFYEGELVLRKIMSGQNNPRGKWAPNWEGPYVVRKTFSEGTLILVEMDG